MGRGADIRDGKWQNRPEGRRASNGMTTIQASGAVHTSAKGKPRGLKGRLRCAAAANFRSRMSQWDSLVSITDEEKRSVRIAFRRHLIKSSTYEVFKDRVLTANIFVVVLTSLLWIAVSYFFIFKIPA